MGDDRLILALDQGTTSSRAIAFGRDGRPVASAQQPFEQRFPSPGHVTHDPEAIWSSQLAVARDVVGAVGGAERIAAIGITNQRETTILWDRATGEPIADAIVWQSRITAPACERLRDAELRRPDRFGVVGDVAGRREALLERLLRGCHGPAVAAECDRA